MSQPNRPTTADQAKAVVLLQTARAETLALLGTQLATLSTVARAHWAMGATPEEKRAQSQFEHVLGLIQTVAYDRPSVGDLVEQAEEARKAGAFGPHESRSAKIEKALVEFRRQLEA